MYRSSMISKDLSITIAYNNYNIVAKMLLSTEYISNTLAKVDGIINIE